MTDYILMFFDTWASGLFITMPVAVIWLIVALFSKNRRNAIMIPLIYIIASIIVFILYANGYFSGY